MKFLCRLMNIWLNGIHLNNMFKRSDFLVLIRSKPDIKHKIIVVVDQQSLTCWYGFKSTKREYIASNEHKVLSLTDAERSLIKKCLLDNLLEHNVHYNMEMVFNMFNVRNTLI